MNDSTNNILGIEDKYSNIGTTDPEDKSTTNTASNVNSYTCNDCKCVFSSNQGETRCIMCNGTNLTNNEVDFSTSKFIPFYRTIDNAIDDYKYKTRNVMIPMVFKNKKVINSIKKVYLPAYLVNANVKGQVRFFGADKISRTDTRKYELTYDSNFDFNNVLVNGYSKLSDEVFNSICTYQYDKEVPYTDDLLNNTFAISYDLVPLEVSNKINNRVMRHCLSVIRGNIQHTLKKLHKNDMDVQIKDNRKIYVPVYILNVEYNNKNHIYIMNGQTGDSYIETDLSIVSIIVFSLILFIIVFGIALAFAYFL